jgi:PAS domain S-box-containing protein
MNPRMNTSPLARISFDPNEGFILLVCVIFLISIFVLDIFMKVGFVVSVLYVIPVVVCIWSPRRRTIWLITGIASLLTIIAIPLKPPGDFLFPLFNRPMSLVAIWTVAFLGDWFTTDRRNAQKALERSNQRTMRILDNIPELYYEVDRDWNFVYVNKKLTDSAGLESTDIIGRNIWELYPMNLGTSMEKNFREAMEKRESRQFEYGGLYSKAWYVMTVHPSTEGILVLGTDITERKNAEEALKDSEGMLEAFFAASPSILTIEDNEFRYVKTDGQTPSYFGLNRESIIGRSAKDLAQGLDEKVDAIKKSVIETGKPVLNVEIDNPIPNHPGEIGYWRASFFPVPLPGGRRGLGIIGVDISERQKMEEVLRRSNAELEQFAYAASHDLQEPLRMIIGHLGLLEKKLSRSLDENTRQNFELAMDGGMRMKALIDDLLEYSRVESRGKPFANVEMNEVVENAVKNISKAIEEVGVELVVHPLPAIWADETQMVQLMQNLLSNAAKFHGKERPRIEVSSLNLDEEIIFAVKDNGIGLNMMHAERIFRMFHRLDSKYPGTGLGLEEFGSNRRKGKGRLFSSAFPANSST